MTTRKLSNRIIFSILIVLLVASALSWFLYRNTRQKKTSMEVKMSRVQVELEHVIDKWCNAEAGSYNSQTVLQGLWRRQFPTTPAYNPHGITKLTAAIGDNQLFKNCEAARNIGPGSFLPGGAIQTVGDLNDFLTPCENV